MPPSVTLPSGEVVHPRPGTYLDEGEDAELLAALDPAWLRDRCSPAPLLAVVRGTCYEEVLGALCAFPWWGPG